MKLRVGEPWMPAKDYGRSLHGLTVNLLVADLEAALAFQREVLRRDHRLLGSRLRRVLHGWCGMDAPR